jgi:hypothetical protein
MLPCFSFEPSIQSVLLLKARVLLSKPLFSNVFLLFSSDMRLPKEGAGTDTSFVPVLLAVGPLSRVLHLPGLGFVSFHHLHNVAGAKGRAQLNCRAHFFHLLFFTKKKRHTVRSNPPAF